MSIYYMNVIILNCSDYYDFAKLVDEININYYYLRFQHDGFLLAHQNPEKPIIKTEDNGKFFLLIIG